MAKTYYSMGVMTADESWRLIRTIRAEPGERLRSVLESSSARRRDFQMALEQSQQQYTAAALIGYESRPLNLFYGLSQAGRAIAAASPNLGGQTGESWQGSGHGLHFDTNIGADGLFASHIRVDNSRSDLFSRLSLAISSPADLGSANFGEVLEQIVDYAIEFPDGEALGRPIHDVNLYSAPATFPVELEVRLPGIPDAGPLDELSLRQIADRYPALRGLRFLTTEPGVVRRSHNADRCMFAVDEMAQLTTSPGGPYVPVGTRFYRRHAVLLPEVGEHPREIAPLASWWLVLFALSMLARYSPHNWTRTMSISQSRVASRTEYILDAALHAVPELVWSELSRIESASSPD